MFGLILVLFSKEKYSILVLIYLDCYLNHINTELIAHSVNLHSEYKLFWSFYKYKIS
jgi:hypothetical protein